MRWIVYLLLAINLGLLTWNLHEEATSPGSRTATVPIVVPDENERDALPLLSELDGNKLRARPTQTAVVTPEPVAAPAQAPALPTSPPPGSDSSAPAGDQAAKVTPPSASVAASASAPAPPVPESAPGSTPAPGAEPDSGMSQASTSSQVCMTLGPLEDKTAIPGIRAWLEEQGAQVDVRTDERREVALYWVFFPPLASRAAAVEQVETMKRQGIDDIIVVPKGDMANAISLGVFSRTESRDRRLKELNGKGYQPSFGPRYRTKVATWADVSAKGGSLDSDTVEARWPGVRVTTAPCPDVPAPARAATEPAEITAVVSVPAPAEQPAPRRFHFSGQSEQ